jgi:hypothetical protein
MNYPAPTPRSRRAAFAALLALLLLSAGAAQAHAKARHGVSARVAHKTLTVRGNGRANRITLRLGRHARNTLQVDVGSNGSADFSFDRGRFGKIALAGGGGNDALRIDERNGAFTGNERTTIDGQGGNDVLSGGSGRETLIGGAGSDTADGNGGRDVVRTGAGNDTFRHDIGDGSDAAEGGPGSDRLLLNGSGRDDSIGVAPAGNRLHVTAGGSTTNGHGFERLDLNAGRRADTVVLGNLRGTGIKAVKVALGARDGQPDGVSASATTGADAIGVSAGGSGASVSGLGAAVSISQAEPARDRLSIDGGDGADRIALAGSPAADNFGLSRNGTRLELRRDGAVTVDALHLERLGLDSAAGPDTIAVDDLKGTDLKQLDLSLGGSPGDGQADSVTTRASDGPDTLTVTGGPGVTVAGLAPAVSIANAEPGDRLTVDGRGDADSIDATGLAAGTIGLTLRGGPDGDTLTGSPGDDAFRSAPGDGADTVEGKGGIDTAAMDGSDAGETFSAAPNGARLQLLRGPDGGSVDADDVERVELNGLGGSDTSTVDDLAGTDVTQASLDLGVGAAGDGQADAAIVNGTANADNLKIAGGGGSVNVTGLTAAVSITHAEPAHDGLTVNALGGTDIVDASTLPADAIALTLNGGNQADTLTGSAGGDVISGGQDNDRALLGPGDDTFAWNPGDGSDTVEGQDGGDRLLFNGSNASESIDLSANGTRLRFFRDVANVTIDAAGVEGVDFNAVGGADTVVVGDLSGTDVTQANVDLAATGGGGDGAADAVIVNGTANADNASIGGGPAGVNVTGLHPAVSVTHSEPANDSLTLNGLAGADTVDASGLAAEAIRLTLNGGDQADALTGSAGDDLVVPGRDNDLAQLGPGDDTLVWNPGDQSDTVEGQAGTDTLQFNGSNVGENVDLSANRSRLRLFRNVAAVTMDAAGVEHVNFVALGGADNITVGDLTGTGVTQANLDLGAAGGAGDGAADNVIVNGTGGDDSVTVSGSAGSALVTGLAATVSIAHAEPANDRLTENALAGDDVTDATGLAADAIGLILSGGNDDDVLDGGAGNDTLNGDAGDDVLIGGPGADTLNGGTGNNVLIQ